MIKQISMIFFLLIASMSSHAMQPMVKAFKNKFKKKPDSVVVNQEIHIDDEIKILFIGDEGVGKTSLINQYSQLERDDHYLAYGFTKIVKDLDISPGSKMRVQFNLAEIVPNKNNFTIKSPISEVDVAIVVFDITNVESFNKCESLLANIERSRIKNAILISSKFDLHRPYMVVLLANNSTVFSKLPKEIIAIISAYFSNFSIDSLSIKALSDRFDVGYFETSKHGLNIEQIFDYSYRLFKQTPNE